jgi:hypothetical protein
LELEPLNVTLCLHRAALLSLFAKRKTRRDAL